MPLESRGQLIELYQRALCAEIERFRTTYGSRDLDTIFIGGGAASTYPHNLLLDTFDTLRKMFIFNALSEVSIEVKPGTVNKEILEVWKSVGINRLSIGVESLNTELLKKLHCHQTDATVYQLLDDAEPLFDNISVDLTLGLFEMSAAEWKECIKKIVAWPIKHVSIDFLTTPEDTELYFKIHPQRVSLPSDEYMVELYHWTVAKLAEHGFEQYEFSNFAKPGYESRHNVMHWDRKPYKAFGLGGCSFDGKKRFQNEKNLMRYVEKIKKGEDVAVFEETLTPEQKHLEKLMLGLKRRTGVSLKAAVEDLSTVQKNHFQKMVAILKKKKLLLECNGRLMLTSVGFFVENEVIAQLSR